MNRNENDILKTIFVRMAEDDDTLPDSFQTKTMERIRKESERLQKRNERLQLILPFAALPVIAGLAVAVFIYMDISLPDISFPSISIPVPYLMMGALTLILLVGDIFMRKAYYKKHPF
ncbi:MAG: hypothetical protein LBS42_01925 [Tannerella sp.]|jgi:hypothetical protein|nr:hypothetical protein [Tannerella sp.]